MEEIRIKSALISVFSKDGLAPVAKKLHSLGVQLISTGGTYQFLKDLDIPVQKVEDLTTYPSILGGRVKTLHPKVFGGILAKREEDHRAQLAKYEIPEIDLVIVDLYPFSETVANSSEEAEIIEKIDIGGISLIRAAAKNYKEVTVISHRGQYGYFSELLEEHRGTTTKEVRKRLAAEAFEVSSRYDEEIRQFFIGQDGTTNFEVNFDNGKTLRYGENPHQKGRFFGPLDHVFEQLSGKELSYNNLVDIDAAVQLMSEFRDGKPAFAVLKHTNACGVALADTPLEAWTKALAGDPVSAFGGILITNRPVNKETAEEINKLFYEVLIAPDFEEDASELLRKKKKRVLLQIKDFYRPKEAFRSILNGVLVQDTDVNRETASDLQVVTKKAPDDRETEDLLFANICVKHLKSNAIVLVKDQQLIGMGAGQTSRVDALEQSVKKAKAFGFNTEGSVMASDAFFPFSDSVEMAHKAGVKAVIQPGGSVRDQDSIDFCNENQISMVFTGIRHFKH